MHPEKRAVDAPEDANHSGMALAWLRDQVRDRELVQAVAIEVPQVDLGAATGVRDDAHDGAARARQDQRVARQQGEGGRAATSSTPSPSRSPIRARLDPKRSEFGRSTVHIAVPFWLEMA